MMASTKLFLVGLLLVVGASGFLVPTRPAVSTIRLSMAKGAITETKEVVEAYKAKARGAVSDKEVEQAFKKLVDLFKGDVVAAVKVVTIQPDVITYINTKPGLRNPNPNR